MNSKTYRRVCKSEKEMGDFSIFLLDKILEQDWDKLSHKTEGVCTGALAAGLYGDLGSGKTAFVKNFAKNLGISEAVTSPTFIIQKNFKIAPENKAGKYFKNIFHLDLYRLASSEELSPINFKETISKKESIVLIEWPEIAESFLSKDFLKIKFEFIDNKTRAVQVFWPNYFNI